FGLAALEAMARGKPVVATQVGGIPEIIQPGVTGLLVPPGNDATLAQAIASLLASPTTAAEMGRNARRDVNERFNPEKLLIRLSDLVEVYLPGTGRAAEKLVPSNLTVGVP
ncbi:MAG: glycosyltransferase, partial [Chloroflexi bacterium]